MRVNRRGDVLSVSVKHVSYVIEPMRFTLGLTRQQMIDDHLTRLARNPSVWREHIDALLDVRSVIDSV